MMTDPKQPSRFDEPAILSGLGKIADPRAAEFPPPIIYQVRPIAVTSHSLPVKIVARWGKEWRTY